MASYINTLSCLRNSPSSDTFMVEIIAGCIEDVRGDGSLNLTLTHPIYKLLGTGEFTIKLVGKYYIDLGIRHVFPPVR